MTFNFFVTKRFLQRDMPELAKQVIAEVKSLPRNAVISVRGEEHEGYALHVRVAVLHGKVQPSHQWSYQTAQEWLNDE
jgi:hypothetical protein